MNTPLPPDLVPLERALESSVAEPSPALCAQLRTGHASRLSLFPTSLPRACEEHGAQSPE